MEHCSALEQQRLQMNNFYNLDFKAWGRNEILHFVLYNVVKYYFSLTTQIFLPLMSSLKSPTLIHLVLMVLSWRHHAIDSINIMRKCYEDKLISVNTKCRDYVSRWCDHSVHGVTDVAVVIEMTNLLPRVLILYSWYRW